MSIRLEVAMTAVSRAFVEFLGAELSGSLRPRHGETCSGVRTGCAYNDVRVWSDRAAR